MSRLPQIDHHKHTAEEYKHSDPFSGDEAKLTCRNVEIRKARKNHLCYGLNGNHDHGIQAGNYYRYEKARVDGSFWGEYRICLRCMDDFIDGRY